MNKFLPVFSKINLFFCSWSGKVIIGILLLTLISYGRANAQTYNFNKQSGGIMDPNGTSPTISYDYIEGTNDHLTLVLTEGGRDTYDTTDPMYYGPAEVLDFIGTWLDVQGDLNGGTMYPSNEDNINLAISKGSGAAFDPTSVILNSELDQAPPNNLASIIITAWNGSNMTGSYTLSNMAYHVSTTVDFTKLTGFTHITKLTFYTVNTVFNLEKLVINPTVAGTTLSSIGLTGSSPTNASSVQYTATFAAAVTGVTAGNFSLASSGITGARITSITGSDSVWTATVNTGTGNGTLGLNMANATGITPSITTTLPFTGSVYTIDKTPPVVTSINRVSATPTTATSLAYTVSFSKPVTGVVASDFTLTKNGTNSSGLTVAKVSSTVYTVTAAGVTGNGTLRLDLNSSGTGITDAVSNAITTGFTTGQAYTLDNIVPTVTSITALGTSPNNGTTEQFKVTFSESVTGVAAADFILTTTNTTGGTALTTGGITSITGSGSIYTVTVGSITGDGTLRLDLKSAATGITDANNSSAVSGFSEGDTYTIQHSAPSIVSITRVGTAINKQTSDQYTVTFSEPVTGVDATDFTLTNSGTTTSGLTVVPVNATVYTVTVIGISGDGTLRLDLNSSGTGITDAATNALSSGYTGGQVYTVDNTKPAVTTGTPSLSTINTGSGPVTIMVTYSDANLSSTSLTTSAITLNKTGTANGTISLTGYGNSYTVSISSITGIGSLGISIGAATAIDAAGNLSLASVASATFAVTTIPQTITFNTLPAKTYGNADFLPGATSNNSGIPITYTSDNSAVATIVNGSIHITGAGTANITSSQAGDSTHAAATSLIQILTTGKANLTITAASQTIAYGATQPILTVTYTGFVNQDKIASLTTVPGVTTPATSTSAAGTYTLTAAGAASSNYTFSYITGTLTIGKANLTITATSQTMTYGDPLPVQTATYTGFKNSDSVASLTTAPTLTTTAIATSGAGSYTLTAAGATSSNYTITYTTGVLTIGNAILTITADNKTQTYGDSTPILTATATGYKNKDSNASLTTVPKVTTQATASSSAGTYILTAASAAIPNYTINYVNGTLTIGKASLTITATNRAMIYGGPLPSLTDTITGFVNQDNLKSLTSIPGVTTNATSASAAGNYKLIAAGGTIPNYIITYVTGILTIGKASLTITADNKTQYYGSQGPDLTASYKGFVNQENSAALLTPAFMVTNRAVNSSVGTYTITGSGATSTNYSINYVTGIFTVIQGIRTLAFNTFSEKTYTDADFVAGATASSGETVVYSGYDPHIITMNGSMIHIAGAGTSTITATLQPNSNYSTNPSITRILTVDKATQAITFPALPVLLKGNTLNLSAVNATSGLPVLFYSADPGIAVIQDQTVTGLRLGTTQITAVQAGNVNFLASVTETQNLTISDAAGDEILAHQAMSPNGDGVNDNLVIEGIQNYPANRVTVINRNGVKIFETSRYDNLTRVFDGHSSITGVFQQQGTYFYMVEYTDKGQTKRKTGFFILKYR